MESQKRAVWEAVNPHEASECTGLSRVLSLLLKDGFQSTHETTVAQSNQGTFPNHATRESGSQENPHMEEGEEGLLQERVFHSSLLSSQLPS